MKRLILIAALAAGFAAPAAAHEKTPKANPAATCEPVYVVVCGPGKSLCKRILVLDCRRR